MDKMTTLSEALSEIEKRTAFATDGPWKALGSNIFDKNDDKIYDSEDMEFIAAARTDVPALLAVVRKLIEQRDYFMSHVSPSLKADFEDAELLAILKGER